MSASPAAAPAITMEDWAALGEDDARELIDGVLEEAEVPTAIHEAVVRWLVVVLDAYFRPRGGFVFASGIKLAVAARRGRLPDVVCYAPGRKPEARDLVRTAPDIVVEVVSRRPRDKRRDRIQKPDDYAAFGVKQYWLVDPDVRTFEVWELDERRRYARAAAALSGMVDVPEFDGLVAQLDTLWEELDRLEGKRPL